MTSILCPACGSHSVDIFWRVANVPVHQNLLYATADAARHSRRGDLTLGVCTACGFVTNTAFDAALLNYTEQYDNTQTYSSVFQIYVETLADDIIRRHALRHKHLIEIGCGKGSFIKLLCERGPNTGVGFDPTYEGDETDSTGQVRFIKDFYTEAYADYQADFFCSRHVIEHVEQPRSMMRQLRAAIGNRSAVIFFETPDVRWIWENVAFWDLFYEHASLYSPGSLARLFAAHGFDVVNIKPAFGGQYQWFEAIPSEQSVGTIRVDVDAPDNMRASIAAFSQAYKKKYEALNTQLRQLQATGRRVVIWGAGGKGVTFLNIFKDAARFIEYVVDINPNKQGHYLPVTAQKIIAPAALVDYQPDIVFLMNPNYADEVKAQLVNLGLTPQLIEL